MRCERGMSDARTRNVASASHRRSRGHLVIAAGSHGCPQMRRPGRVRRGLAINFLRNFYAGFSLLVDPQQPLPQSLPALRSHFIPSLPLQQSAILSSFMQDLASLPPQQDFGSFPAQQEAISFPSCLPMQAGWVSLESDAAIFSQHAHLDFSGVCGVEGVLWVAVCAQETTVRARIRASILYFINSPLEEICMRACSPGTEPSGPRKCAACSCNASGAKRENQIRRTVPRSKGGERKLTAAVSTLQPSKEEGVSMMRVNTRSGAGRITLFSTGMVDGFDGACLTQHGCCSPHGMPVELIARNRIGEIRG